MKEINKIELEQMKSTKGLKVIDFFATWCNPCKMLSPVLEDLNNEINDVEFAKVNTDENMELTMEYGVTSLPTLVFIKDGVEIDRKVGFVPKESLKEYINNIK